MKTATRIDKIHAAYHDAQARATAKLAEIQALLAEHALRVDANGGPEATHYGHVGDIEHAAEVLGQLASQLGGRAE